MSAYILERVSNIDFRYCLGAFADCRRRPDAYDRLHYSIYVISDYVALKEQSEFTFADLIFEMYELQNIISESDKTEDNELYFNLYKIRDYVYYEFSLSKYCIDNDHDETDEKFLSLLINAKKERVPNDYKSKYVERT